jgi:hypothetical protein
MSSRYPFLEDDADAVYDHDDNPNPNSNEGMDAE